MFGLGKRRVQQVKSSFFVNLPQKWAEHWKLTKNSELEVSMDEHKRLIIEPVKPREGASA